MAILACTLAMPVSSAAASPESRLIRKLNEIRTAHGVKPLRPSPSLARSSRAYARWMMRRDYFGHSGRISVSRRFRLAGETLEWHTGWKLRPRYAVRAWMRSAPHRALLLSRRFSRIGVGPARGLFHGRRATMWVAHLGRP